MDINMVRDANIASAIGFCHCPEVGISPAHPPSQVSKLDPLQVWSLTTSCDQVPRINGGGRSTDLMMNLLALKWHNGKG